MNFLICIFFIISFFFLDKSYCVDDQHFEDCAVKKCGNHNISFPFYIQGQQNSSCGYPGFYITCQDNQYPILLISKQPYIIDGINYETQSLRVFNAALGAANGGCRRLGQIGNLTMEGGRFELVNESSQLVLLSNCSVPRDRWTQFSRNKIVCDDDDVRRNDWVLGMYGNDSNLKTGSEFCKMEVVVPMEGSGGGRNYMEVLRRGFLMKWTASNCTECKQSGGRCGFDAKNYQFQCYCRDRPHYRWCLSSNETGNLRVIVSTKTGNLRVVLSTAISAAAFILIICLVFILWRHKKWSNLLRRSSSDIEDDSSYFGVPVFSYKELEEATHNFDSATELGDGGYGAVYYGKLRDGREVAVKRLYENNFKRVEQFMNEIEILTRLRHRNLVSLYGSTSHRCRELLLVYEYIPNGTVADHLHGDLAETKPISWPVRMQIAIETACALAYLHKSDIIHRDVKSTNILLDENFTVKVADFGLSRLLPTDVTHVSTAPQGTPGYVDPEYHLCYQLTEKSDVYSFGVVLVELISSMPAVDISRSRNEVNLAYLAINRIQKCAFAELIDPSLGYENDAKIERMTTSVAELAFRCLQLEKDLRPTMDEVLECLKQIQAIDESRCTMPPPTPESENVVLLKDRKYLDSPVGVADKWMSSRSTTPGTSA